MYIYISKLYDSSIDLRGGRLVSTFLCVENTSVPFSLGLNRCTCVRFDITVYLLSGTFMFGQNTSG